jgi:hypothetical protein
LIQHFKQLGLSDLHTENTGEFLEQTDPCIEVGCAVVAMYHGNGLPVGIVIMSISRYTFDCVFSRTIMAKTEVTAKTLHVRSAALSAETTPVPASPSGGQSEMPASSCF